MLSTSKIINPFLRKFPVTRIGKMKTNKVLRFLTLLLLSSVLSLIGCKERTYLFQTKERFIGFDTFSLKVYEDEFVKIKRKNIVVKKINDSSFSVQPSKLIQKINIEGKVKSIKIYKNGKLRLRHTYYNSKLKNQTLFRHNGKVKLFVHSSPDF